MIDVFRPRVLSGLAGAVLLSGAFAVQGVRAQQPAAPLRSQALPERLSRPQAEDGAPATAGTERIEVAVELSSESIAEARMRADRDGTPLDMPAWRAALRAEQRAFLQSWQGRGDMQVLGQMQVLMNAVILELPAPMAEAMRGDTRVRFMGELGEYKRMLEETTPYVGSTAVQRDLGFDGTGVTVAVLDSGVDYTHAALGGPGTQAAYAAATANAAEPGDLFPTAKVIGGFDFLGSTRPGQRARPDSDPIAIDGHGTHVADIVAGVNGIAPGASIFAVKVCFDAGVSCSPSAILQGLELSMDPNGDGDPSDAVDVINLSLGSDFGGLRGNPQVRAIERAAQLGTVSVASAGNAGDAPFVVGTPAATPSAIAVAETSVPSAFVDQVEVSPRQGMTQQVLAVPARFAPEISTSMQGPVQYGDGAGGALDACSTAQGASPFAPGSLSGKLVLVDRGECDFTEKVQNVERAGGLLTVIGLVEDGPAIVPAGDEPSSIPAVLIERAPADLLRRGGARVRVGPDLRLELVQSVQVSSSRGPQFETVALKPEIGAPGALISAEVGTGSETSRFSGTSGASPVVAGAAALIRQAKPEASVAEIKALLVQNAEVDIDAVEPGRLAPISRIGGGELRVDRSLRASAVALDLETEQPLMSFGFRDLAEPTDLERTIVVRNLSESEQRYDLASELRFDADRQRGAVSVRFEPSSLSLAPGASENVRVVMSIDPRRLDPNPIDSGERFGDSDALTRAELGGFVSLTSSDQVIRMPWLVFPRPAASVEAAVTQLDLSRPNQSVMLRNTGAGPAQYDAFALLGTSPRRSGGAGPDLRAVGVRTSDAPANMCSSRFALEFAVTTWERLPVLLDTTLQVAIDTGQGRFALSNGPRSSVSADADPIDVAQLSVVTRQLGAGRARRGLGLVGGARGAGRSSSFFAEHALNSANVVLRACGEQLGLTAADRGSRMLSFSVQSSDETGSTTDRLGDMRFVPGAEPLMLRVRDAGPGQNRPLTVRRRPPGQAMRAAARMARVGAIRRPREAAQPTEPLGVLLLTNGSRPDSRGSATAETEALLLRGE